MQFVVVRKPKVILTSTLINYFPEQIQELFENFTDIVEDEFRNSLPPIKSINLHNNMIPGESLPNKASYRLTP
jgi:hypothetical protein